MGFTTSGIWTPEEGDSGKPHIYLATMAQSIEDGIGKRVEKLEESEVVTLSFLPGFTSYGQAPTIRLSGGWVHISAKVSCPTPLAVGQYVDVMSGIPSKWMVSEQNFATAAGQGGATALVRLAGADRITLATKDSGVAWWGMNFSYPLGI